MAERERRWNAWGFAGERLPAPAAARAWLSERLGEGDPLPTVAESEVAIPPSCPLPALPAPTLTGREVRLRAACGHSLPDLLGLRTRVCELLERTEADVAFCDVDADAVAVDALARRHPG
jgi:hypothetical protein